MEILKASETPDFKLKRYHVQRAFGHDDNLKFAAWITSDNIGLAEEEAEKLINIKNWPANRVRIIDTKA